MADKKKGIENYSAFTGTVTKEHREPVKKRTHFQLKVEAGGEAVRAAVNVLSETEQALQERLLKFISSKTSSTPHWKRSRRSGKACTRSRASRVGRRSTTGAATSSTRPTCGSCRLMSRGRTTTSKT